MKKFLFAFETIAVVSMMILLKSIFVFAEENSCKTYVLNDCIVEFRIVSEWEDGKNIEVVIKNTSNKTIHNWQYEFETDSNIINMYNARVTRTENGYCIKNNGYNQDIPITGYIQFGYTVTGNDKNVFPNKITNNNKKTNIKTEDFEIRNIIQNEWAGGYCGYIEILNKSEKTIEDWELYISSNDRIVNLWNGDVSGDGNTYIISAPAYIQNINPTESIKIGYQCVGNNNDINLIAFTQIVWDDYSNDISKDNSEENNSNDDDNGSTENNTDDKELKFFVVDNSCFESKNDEKFVLRSDISRISGILRDIVNDATYEIKDSYGNVIQNGKVVINGDKWSIENIGLVLGANFLVFHGNCELENIDESIIIINYNNNNANNVIVDMDDTDGDGISNYYELIYKTDIYKDDTDGDGLNDFIEIYVSLTDPNLKDTDANGIMDSLEDFDEDGLSILDEIELGTDDLIFDFDGDGLSDGFEIYESHSNPKMYDTDGDGLSDGFEYGHGFDCLAVDSNLNGIEDGYEKTYQTLNVSFEDDTQLKRVSVMINTSGMIDSKLTITNIDNIDMLSSNVCGIVGSPVEIETTEKFETAEIVFEYNEAQLNETKEEDLKLLWYDEANYEYVLLEDSVADKDNNTVSYITTHFSKYMLVDSAVWRETMGTRIEYRGKESYTISKNYDLIFLIDHSVNMSDLSKEEAVVKEIVNKIEEGDRVFVGYFDEYGVTTKCLSGSSIVWKKTKSEALNVVSKSTIRDIWGIATGEYSDTTGTYKGDVDLALQAAVIASDDNDGNDALVYVCYSGSVPGENDGSTINSIENSIADLIENHNKIYTISTGENNSFLTGLVEGSGGRAYRTDEIVEILEEYNDRIILGQNDFVDSDGDGIPDEMETKGMRIQNGQVIYSDPNNADTDGDGVIDGEEIIMIVSEKSGYNIPDTVEKLYYFKMISNPTLKDTDGDLDWDNVDPNPMSFCLNDELIEKISRVVGYSEEYIESGENNAPKCKIDEKYWLTFSFIRQFNSDYVGDNWTGVGGDIDDDFVKYVKSKDEGLYDYFVNKKTYFANVSGEMGDLYHLCATETGLIVDSTVEYSGNIKYLMSDSYIDDLSGWAGDLHQAMNCATDYIVINDLLYDYDTYYKIIKILIGYDSNEEDCLDDYNRGFDLADLYADYDAINIYSACNSQNGLRDYFSKDYKNRFSLYIGGKGEDTIKNRISRYVLNNFGGMSAVSVFQWPILDQDFKYSAELGDAITDAYYDRLIELKEKEPRK